MVLRSGPDLENNQVYVWPYFAEWPLAKLTPRQEVELLRLVPPAAVREMKAKGKYTHWRLMIGADGTWLACARATDPRGPRDCHPAFKSPRVVKQEIKS